LIGSGSQHYKKPRGATTAALPTVIVSDRCNREPNDLKPELRIVAECCLLTAECMFSKIIAHHTLRRWHNIDDFCGRIKCESGQYTCSRKNKRNVAIRCVVPSEKMSFTAMIMQAVHVLLRQPTLFGQMNEQSCSKNKLRMEIQRYRFTCFVLSITYYIPTTLFIWGHLLSL